MFVQLVLSIIQEQASSSRWGGPVYASESRVVRDRGNQWTDALSDGQIASIVEANILPTITARLGAISQQRVVSWHDVALAASADEILASPIASSQTDGPVHVREITALSKRTLTLFGV
jgi:hypothetical protein